jgi:enoyl-CoA hydratase/carnithine racemase
MSYQFFQVQTQATGYTIAQLQNGSANTLNQAVISELRQLLRDQAANAESKGLILTGKAKFFSAGLDVVELYQYNQAEIANFWHNFGGMITDLLAFDKPLIASITGHSPAGGCIIALCCDYRIMANERKYKIGLNEVPVGIAVPQPIYQLYAQTIGTRLAYQYLLEGRLLSAPEAQAVGLVDELVEEEQVLARSQAKMEEYLQFGQETWRLTKRKLRQPLLQAFETDYQADLIEHWWSAESRQILDQMIAKLKK